MATEHRFVYRGGGRESIPWHATHVSVDSSVTVIPARLFSEHEHIVEVICHAGVIIIEEYAFEYCHCLKRVVIPGVMIIQKCAFWECTALDYVECDKLEIIQECAFDCCRSLRSLNLPSVKIVEFCDAFHNCEALVHAKFDKHLESIGDEAFCQCHSLERITIPLKNGLFADDDTFDGCSKLRQVDLADKEVINDVVESFLLEEWRNDVKDELDSINTIIPNTYSGGYICDEEGYNITPADHDTLGRKTLEIRDWISRVLSKIIHYKAEHRRSLNEVSIALQQCLPDGFVTNNVLSFLELPVYKFDGEE